MALRERARGLAAAKAFKIALTLVPLAAMTAVAPPAQASVILDPGSCMVLTGTGSCSAVASPGGANSDLNSISVYGDVFDAADVIEIFATGGVQASGGIVGPGSVPVAWDFNILSGTSFGVT